MALEKHDQMNWRKSEREMKLIKSIEVEDLG